jgi:ribonucleoside-diphosphate reductase alpha chain
MSTNGTVAAHATSEPTAPATPRKLPRERKSLTHKFEISGHEGYIIAGLYDDGTVGEILLHGFGKDGSFIQSMMGCWGKAMSTSLQYGQPLHKVVTNNLDVRFEPFGATSNPAIPRVSSIPDYLARWLALHFLSEEERELHGIRLAAQL